MTAFCLRTIFQICALLAFVVLATARKEDFYTLLGIARRATPKEVKKAYRKKSLEFHPDKNKAEDASAKFAEINRAYEVLSDESLKEIYDRQGHDGLEEHEKRQNGGGGGGGGFDPFEDFFGGGFGGQRRGRDEEQRTADVEIPLNLNLAQFYKGEMLDVEYVRETLCTNWEDCMRKDPECSGPGIKLIRQQIGPGFVQQVQVNEPRCVSRGKSWRNNCKACPKGKTQTEKIELSIDVTKGMRPNERITFEGVTDEKPGFLSGHLHFVLSEIPHKHFRRDGDHLYMTREIPLVDALTGFEIELTHVDNHKFTVTIDNVTECDDVVRVPGKGMPRRSGRGFGDLFITFEVDFPDKLSAKQKAMIRKTLLSSGDDEL